MKTEAGTLERGQQRDGPADGHPRGFGAGKGPEFEQFSVCFPELETMTRRRFDERAGRCFNLGNVPIEHGHHAHAFREDAAKRTGMIEGGGMLNGEFGGRDGLSGVSLQPQNACQVRKSRSMLTEAETKCCVRRMAFVPTQ